MTVKINQPVDVTAVLFNQQFEALPRRIEFDGRSLTFGKSNIESRDDERGKLFDLRSGSQTYRIRHDKARWTLLEILTS